MATKKKYQRPKQQTPVALGITEEEREKMRKHAEELGFGPRGLAGWLRFIARREMKKDKAA